MPRHKDERTAHCRQEASACAQAALVTAIIEIRQAYLDLEQGWLSLARKGEGNSSAFFYQKPAQTIKSNRNGAPNDSGAHDAV